jgi:chloramphenicol O-acetyltransferase type A
MTRYLDLSRWPRRSHFDLFRSYDSPYFNVCANVDVTRLREVAARSEQLSFFLATLFLSTRVANELESFRYRIRGDRVLVHETVHAGSTVLLDDETFSFAYFDFTSDFARFQREARGTMRTLASTSDALNPRDDRDDLIHYSVIPWISFTSFTHARRFNPEDSTPKIVFGKYVPDGDRLLMPVSVEVHHGLMDGLHVGEYFSRLGDYLDQPGAALQLS